MRGPHVWGLPRTAWLACVLERSNGELKPAQQLPVGPADFKVYAGQEPQVALCVALMILGFAIVWWVHARWGDDSP